MPNMILNSNGSPEQTDARRRLALAISAKGVPTDAKASFIQMAENVAQIPQQYSDGESYFASFVAPEEYMFNVFGICEKMIGENPHPEFPAFFVAEYYRGYDSLVLTGADAYLTCDGDFYQTLDKTVEVTHVWHDADNGKSNRYVVFYYMQDGYTFTNSTVELCPRRVALAGRCASFVVIGENRLTDVYVLGTLENFNGGTTGTSWNPAQVIRNYVEHNASSFFVDFENKQSVIFPELAIINGGTLFSGRFSCVALSFPSLTKITSGKILKTISTVGLSSFSAPMLHEIGSHVFEAENSAVAIPLKEIVLPSLKIMRDSIWFLSGNTPALTNLEYIGLDAIEIVAVPLITTSPYQQPNLTKLKRTYLPSSVSISVELFGMPYGEKYIGAMYGAVSLIDIEVGSLVSNLKLTTWNPTNVLSTPEGVATINKNIRDHIAAKVSDRTGDTALTFTVSANLYANLEQATIDAFTAKNWNVAGA